MIISKIIIVLFNTMCVVTYNFFLIIHIFGVFPRYSIISN